MDIEIFQVKRIYIYIHIRRTWWTWMCNVSHSWWFEWIQFGPQKKTALQYYRTYKPCNLSPKSPDEWSLIKPQEFVTKNQVKASMRWLMRSVVCVPTFCHVVGARSQQIRRLPGSGGRGLPLRFAPGSVAERLRGGCVQVWLENDVWLSACIYMPQISSYHLRSLSSFLLAE